MKISEKICLEVCRLPEELAYDVMNYIDYIEFKYGIKDLQTENLKQAQIPVMNDIWDNKEDEVWNDL